MLAYLLRLFALAVVSSSVIRFYYSGSSVYPRTFVTAWWWWIAAMFVLYLAYKAWLFVRRTKSFGVSPMAIIGGFSALLLVLSFAHASFVQGIDARGIMSGGFALFGRAFFSCFVPVGLVWLWWASGLRLLRLFRFESEFSTDRMLSFFVPLSLGFTLYATGLTVAGSTSTFTASTIGIWTLAVAALSFRELAQGFAASLRPMATVETGIGSRNLLDAINLKLITGEWAVIVTALVVAVGFINIVRPTPIGWDDLGVYMNYPKLIAGNAAVPEGVGFVPWQLVTAIGFLMGSALQAFYINQIGGALAFFAVFLALSGWLGSRRGYMHWPLVCAMLAVTMPMVIFQQARDMKLDTVVLFLSVVVLYVAIHWIRHILLPEIRETGRANLLSRRNVGWIVVIGVLTGFVFSVKITSLMLILGLLGLFAYSFYGLLGFLAFFSLFVALFTKLGLWSLLNISTLSNPGVIMAVSTVGGAIGIASLVVAMIRSKTVSPVAVIAWLGIFFLAVFAPLAPWLAKNISEIRTVSVLRIVTGEPAVYSPDFSKIYSPEKIAEIEANATDLAVNESGQTANEDFGRYFGNEEGINNYLKLPYNRTFQKTQNGEFTEIGYVFLAFFPILLIFLPGVRAWFVALVIVGVGGYWFYTLFPDTLASVLSLSSALEASKNLTAALGGIMLPGGYLVIIAIFAIGTLAMLFGFRRIADARAQGDHELFRLLTVFTAIYGFVYLISSYGVPWYGILLYFCLFGFISLAGSSATDHPSQIEDEWDRDGLVRFYAAVVMIVIVGVWTARTTVSDAVSHLANVEYASYRLGTLNQEEALATYHPNYFPIVSELNVRDQASEIREILDAEDVKNLKSLLTAVSAAPKSLLDLAQLLSIVEASDLRQVVPSISTLGEMAIKQEAKKARIRSYQAILSPDREAAADTPIYRIGTFLSYYIADNIHRYYEDSLLFNYRSWFADSDPDTVARRMHETGFKHLLLDVNASTIDTSPPYDLTDRFESLLLALRSTSFELVSTDDPCLESALREQATLTPQAYLMRAGVSYDSAKLLPDGTYEHVSRYAKRLECYSYFVDLVKQGRVTDTSNYSYLMPYAENIRNNQKTIDAVLEDARSGRRNYYQVSSAIEQLTGLQSGWMALFRINGKDAVSTTTSTASTPAANTATGAAAASGATGSGEVSSPAPGASQ
jgi:hypothetical protein